jgi:serine/threonine protein kinase
MDQVKEGTTICPACGYTQGTPPKEAYHMAPESILNGKYVIGRVLGYGGFGVTYLGWDVQLEHKVAIKEYLPSDFSTRMPGETKLTIYHGEAGDQFAAGLERFVAEAQRLAKFNSTEGIVDIYDTFVENSTGYIVMQFLDGFTVKEMIDTNGALPYDTARDIVVKVLETLKEVHKAGVIHRDLSPDNIFITHKNEVKLLDFGAARYATTLHSKSLSVILKPGYAPEEQYRSRGNQGSWSDIYALAATFYKMLTGITPDEAMERAIQDTVLPPSKLGIALSASAENAIMNAMNVRIEERTQTAAEFIAALQSEEVKRVEPVKLKADVGKFPLWLKISSAVLGVVVLVLGVLIGSGVIPLIPKIVGASIFKSEQVNTPGVVLMSQAEADEVLKTAGLVLQVEDLQFSDKVAKDKIMLQEPLSGKPLDKGALVSVTVSNGTEADYIAAQAAAALQGKVSIPNLVGMREEAALAELQKLGITVNAVTRREDDVIAADGIIAQSMAEGTLVDKGTALDLVVSTGRPATTTAPSSTTKPNPGTPNSSEPTPIAPTPTPTTPTTPSTPPQQTPVAPVKVNSVSISGKATIEAGDGTQLSLAVSPSNADNTSVSWRSSNENVASVSSTGYVTAKNIGSATISATAADGSGASGSMQVRVLEPQIHLTGVVISSVGNISLSTVPTITLTCEFTPRNATNQKVVWSIADESVAKLIPKGNQVEVVGIKPGTARIKVVAEDGNVSNTLDFFVMP